MYPNETVYGRSFDLLYVGEQLVLAAGLMLVWRRSRGAWRSIYFNLFVASLLYCVASLMASEAIDLHLYYTGSLFDVPLVAGMVWFVRIGLLPRETAMHRFARRGSNSRLRDLESATRHGGRVRHAVDDGVGRNSAAMRHRASAHTGCC